MGMPPVDNQMPQGDMMGGFGDEMPMGNEPGQDMDGFGVGTPQGGQSEYDTNFDAGVEADEDTDPKKFIQQLTGKLSTTLNSYNGENGDDEGLNKYVAKMIVKATTKNMDDATKKDIIKAINTSQNPEPDDDEPSQDENPEGGEEMSDFGGEGQQPMMEGLTKKQILEMAKRKKCK